VGQINYQIDLHRPVSRKHNKILQPKSTLILFYLTILVLLILFCLLLDGYILTLQAETELLKQELAVKTEAAAPLIAMSVDLESCKRRTEITENLLSGYLIKTDYLIPLKTTSLPGLRINYLTIDAEGMVTLRGSGTNLQSAALYARKLRELPFISIAELTAADLNEDSSCFFSIRADLKPSVGGEETDQ